MTESTNDEAIILPSLMSYRDIAHHDFVPPPAGAIETRAARRRRRRIVTSAAAGVALIGVSTILLLKPAPPVDNEMVTNPSSPVASPAAEPSPTESPDPIPSVAMLTGLDLWDGGGAIVNAEATGDWRLISLTSYCAKQQPLSYPGPQPARSETRDRILKKGEITVIQRVTHTDEPHQRYLMQWYRDFISNCAATIQQATGERPEIIAEGFGGDESFIVRHGVFCWVIVRQGGLSSEIAFSSGETEQDMRSVGVKAATRMSRAA